MLLLDFQRDIERKESVLILGVSRVRPRVMVHHTNEDKSHNHDMTNKES
jgi:hypothetical protein